MTEAKVCHVCKTPLLGRRTAVCSLQCRRAKLYRSEAFADAQAKYRAAQRKRGISHHRSKSRKCQRCDGGWVRRDAKYCSRACAAAARPPAPSRPPRQYQKRPPTCCAIFVKKCPVCFRVFTARHKRTAICSGECGVILKRRRQHVKSAARRARLKNAFVENVDPMAVFERDRWICQLCFEPIDPLLRGYGPDRQMSASVDHVIPLSRGGKHEMANVQSAHFICNSRKGAGERLEVA